MIRFSAERKKWSIRCIEKHTENFHSHASLSYLSVKRQEQKNYEAFSFLYVKNEWTKKKVVVVFFCSRSTREIEIQLTNSTCIDNFSQLLMFPLVD